MNVKEIIVKYLRENGYDGLCNIDSQCGCEISDSFPCDICDGSCEPAIKTIVTAEDIDDGDYENFEVGDEIFVPKEEAPK